MDIIELRAAFELLGFEKPIKDKGRVKAKYRDLILASNSDHAQSLPLEEQARRDSLVREILKAKTLCMGFCESPLSEEEIEQASKINEDDANAYLKMVQLFIGRILQYRFRFWAHIPLSAEAAVPEFDQEVVKSPLGRTTSEVFKVLSVEHGRPDVRWVLTFEVEATGAFAWVVMEMTDGSCQAQVFFTVAPGKSNILPEVTQTLRTFEEVSQLLHEQGLQKVRGVRGSDFWGMSPADPWQIQVTGSGAALCWMTTLEGSPLAIGFYRANSVEDLQEVLSKWIDRVKVETWAGPL